MSSEVSDHGAKGTDEVLQQRALCQQGGGQQDYSYETPFIMMDVFVDEVEVARKFHYRR